MSESLRYLPGFTLAPPELKPEQAHLRKHFAAIVGVAPEWQEFFRTPWTRHFERAMARHRAEKS